MTKCLKSQGMAVCGDYTGAPTPRAYKVWTLTPANGRLALYLTLRPDAPPVPPLSFNHNNPIQ
jgi:hypothetical protein